MTTDPSPEKLLEALAAAKTQVANLELGLSVAQSGRDAEVAEIHSRWHPVVDGVQKELDAARLAVKNALKAIDDATNPPPSATPETEEPSGDAQVLVVTGMSEDGQGNLIMTTAPLSSIEAEEPTAQ